MKQESVAQQLAHLEQKLNARIQTAVNPLLIRVDELESPDIDSITFTATVNQIVNSHPDYSHLAYTTAGTAASTVSDDNRRAYNWQYQTAATSNLSGAATPLLASGHSGFAGLNADAPVWDAVNGTFNLGGDTVLYDIACLLPTDFVFPGQTYHIYFEASLASAAVDKGASQQIYCGFWDDTAGQEKWIEGTFSPTASVYGVPGSRSLEYKILAKTDSGTEMLSSAINVSNAPATMSEANHVRLSFSGVPGFIYFGIYRKDGSNYRLVHETRNSIDLQFFDMQENAGSPQPGYPSVSATTPQAYAVSDTFEPGELSSTSFLPHTMTVKAPLSYNRSNTANGNQWFRFGLVDLMPSSTGRRGIVIRRLSVSEGYGGWSRCPLDLQAASGPTSTMTGAPPSGNPVFTPPPGGSGGVSTCVTLDMGADVYDDGQVRQLTMQAIRERLENGERIYVANGGIPFRVLKWQVGMVQFVWRIELKNGLWLTCSDTQAIFSSPHFKKLARHLKTGDIIHTKKGLSPIVEKKQILGEREVMWITIGKPHQYVVNGIYVSNEKPLSGGES